ncbi:hypothetical protein ABIC28_002426 [Rhodococcus sp. PvR044]|uniref:hypothetical protein n=1 Tax=Rhodococcus sp. PvR044 TaxID=3156402 RepID=UPI0033971F83
MFARSTTIQAHPSFIDAGIKHIRDTVMPALAELEGCAGLSLLVDHDSGRCIATSSWMDEESLRRSEGPVLQLRDEAAKAFNGTTTVERWDIAILHRDHHSSHGACVRAVWLKLEPGRMDHAIDVYKMVSMPAMEDLEGFCSASLLVDHAAGRAVSSVTFDSHEAMDNNRELAQEIRAAAVREMGSEILEVCEFELAIAHLHVPEMA